MVSRVASVVEEAQRGQVHVKWKAWERWWWRVEVDSRGEVSFFDQSIEFLRFCIERVTYMILLFLRPWRLGA
jgi:hypothetical protein